MKATALLVAVVALLTPCLTAPAALGATAQQTINDLNVQRAANGIPAGIAENPTWSTDCAKHDHYMAVNNTLTHNEDPTAIAYSSEGQFAGQNSVLTQGSTWDNGNPYEFAPLHLDQLLAPRLQTLGSADVDGFSCTTTFPGWTRPDPPALTIYTYPGNGGTIYPSEVARELPWTPGDLVGLTQPARTGPMLFVLVDAPAQTPFGNPATLTDASVSGPTGPVQIETVDGNTTLPAGSPYPTLANYISPGGFIIPVRPLIPGTTYRAHIVVSFGGILALHDWTFTTSTADPRSSLTAKTDRLSFSSQSSAPIVVTFARSGGASSPAVTIRPGQSAQLKLSPGTWRACGHQAAANGFSSFDQCLTLTIAGVPTLRFGKPAVDRTKVRLSVSFSSVLRGHLATMSVTPLAPNCPRAGCKTTTHKIRLRARSILLPLPPRGHGLDVALRTDAFQQGGATWEAARAVVIYTRR